jgi:hypothetical protein
MTGNSAHRLVAACYQSFTLSDGALRMLALLHMHARGGSPLQIALSLLPYEIAGVFTNLLAGRIGASISDILGDRAEEQKRLLKNDAYIAAVFADRVFADIDTIDANRAACHIVEAAYKVDQGAFPCAARSD